MILGRISGAWNLSLWIPDQ